MRNAIAVLLAVLATTVAANAAPACSCARNPNADDIFMSSHAVFTGTVRLVERIAPGRLATTFLVTEPFKGVARGTLVRVEHGASPPACGVVFEQDYSYTLAAGRPDEGALTTGQCQTWMFLPNSGLGKGLIDRLRTLRR
jgi:hypothetical protein